MKRYMNAALLYAVLAMAGGVFYREFTKFTGFTAKTTLSVIHTHYFMLGMGSVFAAAPAGKEFFFYRSQNRKDPGSLSHWAEPDCPNAGGPGNPSGPGYTAFFQY